MKRSSMILLGATGVIIAGSWLGRSPNPAASEVEAGIYGSIAECKNAGVLDHATCEAEFAAAAARHTETAPRFSQQTQCEEQYGSGQCKPATIAGTSYFIPAMVGFLVANHLANRRQAQALLPPKAGAPQCAPGMTPQTQPGCVPPRGSSTASAWRSYSTSRGYTINRAANGVAARVRMPTEVIFRPPARTTTGPVVSRTPSVSRSSGSSSISRGGFGSSGRSFSSSSS